MKRQYRNEVEIIKLIVCNSGSDGNTYLLNSDSDCVVLDCGVNLKIVKKSLKFKVNHIKFALCTHIHKDHSRYIQDYLNMGVKVYMPMQVKEMHANNNYAIHIEPMKKIEIEGFSVTPFEVPHDKDIVCYAYIIENTDFGKLLYMTDCMYCKYNFRNTKINHFLCECNHMKDLLDEKYEKFLRDRVMSTHMDLDTCKSFIAANKTNALRTVILCHMGAETTIAEECLPEVQNVVGEDVNVFVARKNLDVELSKYPF